MILENSKSVALIVAHPDDEVLWAGGTLLNHPTWNCFIVCLCRGSDTDRAPKFFRALKLLKAQGAMGNLDDGSEQIPLDEKILEDKILKLLPSLHFDLLITHNTNGEYTRHLRHEETGQAVIKLWQNDKISATELWTFAYEDGNKRYFPVAIKSASVCTILSKTIWQQKYKLITQTYGFEKDSWEAKATPKVEAFWKLTTPCRNNNNNKGVIL